MAFETDRSPAAKWRAARGAQSRTCLFRFHLINLVAAIIALALLFAPKSALAQSETIEMTPRQAVIFLIRSGDIEKARQLLRQLPFGAEERAALEIEIARAEGRFGDAIEMARAAVRKSPKDAGLRLGLAELLALDRRYFSAEAEYGEAERLAKTSTNKALRERIAKRKERASRHEDYDFSLRFTPTPSQNINGANIHAKQWLAYPPNPAGIPGRYVDAPEELQPQSGWRLAPGFSAQSRHDIADQFRLIYELDGDIQVHTPINPYDAISGKKTIETLDTASLAIGARLRNETGRGRQDIGLGISRDWGDGERYNISTNLATGVVSAVLDEVNEDSVSYEASYLYRYTTSPRLTLTLNMSAEVTKYDSEEDYGYRDNVTTSIRPGYEWKISKDAVTNLSVGVGRYDERGPSYIGSSPWRGDHNHTLISVGWRGIPSVGDLKFEDWNLRVNAELRHLWHDAIGSYEGKLRVDDTVSISARVLNTELQWYSLSPAFSCNASVTSSNIDQFDQLSGGCGLTFVRGF